jgi:hypothetical protein
VKEASVTAAKKATPPSERGSLMAPLAGKKTVKSIFIGQIEKNALQWRQQLSRQNGANLLAKSGMARLQSQQ